jgi:protein SCO1/2
MNRFIPYILIVFTVLFGFYLKHYLAGEEVTQPNGADKKENESNNNKIIDQFDTLLIYPKKKDLREFELWDFNKEPFVKSNFNERWSLIFIGFTNCPDVCHNTLNDLTHLYQGLNENLKKQFQFVFFSVDPERDTPQRMKSYLDNFHDDFIGISGQKNQIDSVVHQLGGLYNLNKAEGEYYSVDHSGRIFIVDQQGRRFGLIKSGVLQSKDKSVLLKELESLL